MSRNAGPRCHVVLPLFIVSVRSRYPGELVVTKQRQWRRQVPKQTSMGPYSDRACTSSEADEEEEPNCMGSQATTFLIAAGKAPRVSPVQIWFLLKKHMTLHLRESLATSVSHSPRAVSSCPPVSRYRHPACSCRPLLSAAAPTY